MISENNSYNNTAVPAQEQAVKEFINTCLRNWHWFLLSVFTCLLLAFLYLKLAVPVYDVSASILVKQPKTSEKESKESVLNELNVFDNTKIVENEMEILKSRILMDKVVRSLGLNVSYFSSPDKTFLEYLTDPWYSKQLYKYSPIRVNVETIYPEGFKDPMKIEIVDKTKFKIEGKSKLYTFGESVNTEDGKFTVHLVGTPTDDKQVIKVKATSIDKKVDALMEALEVTVRGKNATVFHLEMEDAVPVRGTDLLNALIEEYNKSAIEEKNREASKALAFIDDRLKLITGELSTVEQDVQAYKTSKEITDISTQSAQLLEQMKENDSQLNQVNIQLSTLASVDDYIDSGDRNSPPNVFTADPVLQNKLNKLNDLELERTRLLSTTGESNPLVEGINEQIANTKSSIRYSIQDIKTGLSTTKNSLERNNAQYASAIRAVPQKERSLINIERQKNIKQDLYLYLLQKREETALSYAAMVIDSQIVDPPQSSTIPVRPSKAKALAVALLLGGLIPIGSIWGKKILNNKILNKQLIEDATNAPILGVIGKNHTREVMVVKEGSRTAISEQFRFLRTNLQYIDQGKNYKTILVTSSISNEGKSFISLNLGSSISITGKKTVILEMDFRKPDIGNKIHANKRLGLSDYLNGHVTLDEIIVPVENQPNLYLLPCGAIPANPAELLLSDKLDDLFNEVSALFDQVIIDSPPIGLVTDALLLEKYAQASIYVVRYGYTLVPHLKMISDLHNKGKFKNMSIVFNAVDLEASEEYMYNDHGYYTHNASKKLVKRLKLN